MIQWKSVIKPLLIDWRCHISGCTSWSLHCIDSFLPHYWHKQFKRLPYIDNNGNITSQIGKIVKQITNIFYLQLYMSQTKKWLYSHCRRIKVALQEVVLDLDFTTFSIKFSGLKNLLNTPIQHTHTLHLIATPPHYIGNYFEQSLLHRVCTGRTVPQHILN